ncbi:MULTISPECIES: hypothetical protein [unclassified Streptomyces]|uniref:hypothetical protein n=1 Tax=unclassified Streptomyces TaxID=2593676 RepID=UPI00344DB5B8
MEGWLLNAGGSHFHTRPPEFRRLEAIAHLLPTIALATNSRDLDSRMWMACLDADRSESEVVEERTTQETIARGTVIYRTVTLTRHTVHRDGTEVQSLWQLDQALLLKTPRHEAPQVIEDGPDHSFYAGEAEARVALDAALGGLPPVMTVREVAEFLGTTEDALGQALHRNRARFSTREDFPAPLDPGYVAATGRTRWYAPRAGRAWRDARPGHGPGRTGPTSWPPHPGVRSRHGAPRLSRSRPGRCGVWIDAFGFARGPSACTVGSARSLDRVYLPAVAGTASRPRPGRTPGPRPVRLGPRRPSSCLRGELMKYRPPARLPQWQQTSPSSAIEMSRPPAGERPAILNVHGQPIEFRHEHYQVEVTRAVRAGGGGEDVVQITARAWIEIPGLTGLPDTVAALREYDRQLADGEFTRLPPPRSRQPSVYFPPYVIACPDPTDHEVVEEMTWRAMESAVQLADVALGVAGQVAGLRSEQSAAAEA